MTQRLFLSLIVFFSYFLATLPALAQLSLQSTYFLNDSTALSIIAGNPYHLSDSVYFTPDWKVNTQSFEYKLINSFRQLGYKRLTFTETVNQSASTVSYKNFLRRYLLPESDFIDANTLFLIDNEVYQREQYDFSLASIYLPTIKIINTPASEPSKYHLTARYQALFSLMPDRIEPKILTIDDFRMALYEGQVNWTFGKMMDPAGTRVLTAEEMKEAVQNKADYSYCPSVYYKGLADEGCVTPNNIVEQGITSDFEHLAFVTHEYGHIISWRTWVTINGENKLLYQFFAPISFDITGSKETNPNFPYIRSLDVNEFISDYADMNQYEDFAESFTAYLDNGEVFRERAKTNQYLQKKYDFLRRYVFNGKEFMTGNLNSYELYIANHGTQILPNHPEDYYIEDPDWVWDYLYPVVPRLYKIGWNNIFWSDFTENQLDSNCEQYGWKENHWIGESVGYGLSLNTPGNGRVSILCR